MKQINETIELQSKLAEIWNVPVSMVHISIHGSKLYDDVPWPELQGSSFAFKSAKDYSTAIHKCVSK